MWKQSSRQRQCAYALLFSLFSSSLFSPDASAQTGPYQSTAIGTIGGATPCGSANYTTNITVADDIIIARNCSSQKLTQKEKEHVG